MREFKFRIWDSEYKEMLYSGNMLSQESGRVYANYNIGTVRAFPDGCYSVMQYTGLKDSNKKEIWEGDIVCGLFFDTDYMSDISVTCPVVWVERHACFNIGHRHWTLNSIRVVGNIHENPELLNK